MPSDGPCLYQFSYQFGQAIYESGGHELLPVGLQELLVEFVVNSTFRVFEKVSGKSAAFGEQPKINPPFNHSSPTKINCPFHKLVVRQLEELLQAPERHLPLPRDQLRGEGRPVVERQVLQLLC